MKKRVMFVLAFIFLCYGVLAVSGVSPSNYDVDFKSGFESNFTFNFISDEGIVSRLSVDGDLAKYVSLDRYRISGSEKVVAIMKLPEKVENYGVNKIRVSARQVPENNEGIGMISDVGGIIRITVPYPWKYAETSLKIPDGSQESLLNISLNVKNLGNLTITAKSQAQIFENDKLKEILYFDDVKISPLEEVSLSKKVNVSNYFGDYGVVALVDYGGAEQSRAEDFFRIGKLFIDVKNYTKEVKKSLSVPFFVNVTNLWNNEIDNFYAEVSVDNFNFSSPLEKINSWEDKSLVIYLDTSKMEGSVDGNLTLFYGDASMSFPVSFEIKEDFFVTLIIIIIVLVFIFLLVFYFIFGKRFRFANL